MSTASVNANTANATTANKKTVKSKKPTTAPVQSAQATGEKITTTTTTIEIPAVSTKSKSNATKKASTDSKTKSKDTKTTPTNAKENTIPESDQQKEQQQDKKSLTPESVTDELREITAMIKDEIDRLKTAKADAERTKGTKNGKSSAKTKASPKVKGIKFLSTINKKLSSAITRNTRLLKAKHKIKTNKPRNTSSGFMKPVYISPEMAKFTNWNVNEPYPRTQVTKFLCDYIKAHNLQDAQDRRIIRIESDPKLATLLNYTKKADDKPLTYFSLQQLLKPHFPKQPKNVQVAA